LVERGRNAQPSSFTVDLKTLHYGLGLIRSMNFKPGHLREKLTTKSLDPKTRAERPGEDNSTHEDDWVSVNKISRFWTFRK